MMSVEASNRKKKQFFLFLLILKTQAEVPSIAFSAAMQHKVRNLVSDCGYNPVPWKWMLKCHFTREQR